MQVRVGLGAGGEVSGCGCPWQLTCRTHSSSCWLVMWVGMGMGMGVSGDNGGRVGGCKNVGGWVPSAMFIDKIIWITHLSFFFFSLDFVGSVHFTPIRPHAQACLLNASHTHTHTHVRMQHTDSFVCVFVC